MSELERLQARIDDLEVRHAFQEDLIRQLDEVTQALARPLGHLGA
jgi:uncharacterized coiled-coil protein SlyX